MGSRFYLSCSETRERLTLPLSFRLPQPGSDGNASLHDTIGATIRRHSEERDTLLEEEWYDAAKEALAGDDAGLLTRPSPLRRCRTPGAANKEGDVSGISLTLVFPEEYAVDRERGLLYNSSLPTMNAAPSYITRVTVTITGNGIEPIVQQVPLDTGVVEGTLPAGTYTFAILVETTLGDSFTGSTTTSLAPGVSANITINLDVNAPPSSLSISASNRTPKPNESITLTATVVDPDGDPVTFSWNGGGGAVVGSGATVGWSAAKGGDYTVTVTATDPHGGALSQSVTITVLNNLPVVTSVTANPASPVSGQNTTLTCAATDLDGDPLTYTWNVGGAAAITGTGATVTARFTQTGPVTVTCTVNDGQGGSGSRSLNTDVVNLTLARGWTTGNLNCPQWDGYKITSSAAASITVSCTSSASFWLNAKVTDFDWIGGGSGNNLASQSASGAGLSVTMNASLPQGTFYLYIGEQGNPGVNVGESYSCTVSPSATIFLTTPSPLNTDWVEGC